MHFSTVAIPALAGVALVGQTSAADTLTNASNTGNSRAANAYKASEMTTFTKVNNPLSYTTVMKPTTTTKLLTTTTCVTTPDVTTPEVKTTEATSCEVTITEVILTEVIITEVTSTTTVPPAPTVTVTPGTEAANGATMTLTTTVGRSTKTVTSGVKAVDGATMTLTPAAIVSVGIDDPSDDQPSMGVAVHVFSTVVTSGATRRVQVPGIFRLPVQLWKAASGLFLQGAVVNAHGAPPAVTTTTFAPPPRLPGTVTVAGTTTVTATTAMTTEKAMQRIVSQIWDDKNDNIPPQTVIITVNGDNALSQEASTTVTTTVTSTPVLSDPITVHSITTTRTTGVPTLTETVKLPVATSGATRNGPPAVVSMALKAWRYFN